VLLKSRRVIFQHSDVAANRALYVLLPLGGRTILVRLPKRRFQPRFGETRSFYCIQESVGNAFLLVRDVLK